MVTVPANKLIASLPTDRMPAVLAPEDWSAWLGEEPSNLDRVKACLKTVEGVRWTMTKEERKADPKTKRRPPTVSDPGDLFQKEILVAVDNMGGAVTARNRGVKVAAPGSGWPWKKLSSRASAPPS